MTDHSTEALLEELARDLQPVRALPRLRAVALATVGAWGLVVVAHAVAGGGLPRLPGAWHGAESLAVLAGLALAAAGGLAASLAGAVPGRERAARVGVTALLLGLLFALAAAAVPLIGRAGTTGFSAEASLGCVGHAALLGAVPLTVLGVFLVRSLVRRPRRSACAASLAGLALGAVAVHMSCTADGGALHVLMGHALGPTALAFALALPVAELIRRASSRAGAV